MATATQGEAAASAWPESATLGQDPLPEAELQTLSRASAAVYHYKRRTESAVRARGLQPAQYLLLLALAASPEQEWRTSRELAAELCLSHHEFALLVHLSEGAGLVHTTRDPEDRRGAHIRLTPHGSRIAARLAAADRAALAALAERLPAAR
jgi:DNA-binding MarR family transcriptional regulator